MPVPDTLKELHRERILAAAKYYRQDLESMSDEQLGASPGGKARTPFDFTYEVAFVNNNLGTIMKGDPPLKEPESEGWVTAPNELKSKPVILAYFDASIEKLLAGLDSLAEDKFKTPFEVDGKEKSYIGMANLAIVHMFYHCGQLNYVQSILGDDAIHWQ